MSDDFVKVNTRVPREIHGKLKAQADAEGVYLNEVIIAHLRAAANDTADRANSDSLAVLTQTRTSPLFGEETILQEMLRRIVSMQMLAVKIQIDGTSKEQAQELLDGIDDEVRMILETRFGAS